MASSSTDARLDQMQMMIQQQNQEIQQLQADEANEASAAQMNEATQAQVGALQDKVNAVSDADKGGWWYNTKVSGRMYFDITDATQKTNGADTTFKGYSFDIKRFYIGIDHKFDDMWSANITTDFTYDSNSSAKATQLYIKKAYLDAHIDDALDVKLGSTDLPWIPFAEGVYGYRYVENTLIDRTKIGTSADWGVHLSGKFADGMFSYAISAINGAGYKAPPGPGNGVKFKSIDVEGRVSANIDDFVVAVGGYTGKLGKDMELASPAPSHTATRFNALAAYKTKEITAGVEYFSANDWNSVTSSTTDKEQGWSGFASYKFDPQWAIFGRYDSVNEKLAQPSVNKPDDTYYNAGIEWSPTKIVSLSLVYKHDNAKHGALANQNGTSTLGSTTLPRTGTYNELGIFGILQW